MVDNLLLLDLSSFCNASHFDYFFALLLFNISYCYYFCFYHLQYYYRF